jgi:hypothetical protein
MSGLVVKDADLVSVSLVDLSDSGIERLLITVPKLLAIDYVDCELSEALSVVIQEGVRHPSSRFLATLRHRVLELLIEFGVESDSVEVESDVNFVAAVVLLKEKLFLQSRLVVFPVGKQRHALELVCRGKVARAEGIL